MAILQTLLSWFNSRRIEEIDQYTHHGEEIQKLCFNHLMDRAKHTIWGETYGYGSMNSHIQYKSRVPLQCYEDIKPYVERIIKGEENVLWSGKTRWFAKSSGTTQSKSKFIPITADSLEECHYRAAKDIQSIYFRSNPQNNVLGGKTLTLGGSHKVSSLNNNSSVGDLSAVMIENLPFWTDLYRTPAREVTLTEAFDKKVAAIIEHSLDEDVTAFAGVPSWYLVLFHKILETTGANDLNEIWPNLELFVHGGISFSPYKEQYKKLIPSSNMHYLETYNASEGFFAIQDVLSRDDMLLMLDLGIFYEFIPMDQFNGTNSDTITLGDVEKDKNYAIVISTNGGLWRYIIGDTIKFTSTHPYRIKVTGRTSHFMNAFGEEIIIENALRALEIACRVTEADIKEFTAAPIYFTEDKQGSHQWAIEFNKQPKSLPLFKETLDKSLQEVNSDYEAKRFKNTTLNAPELLIIKNNSFFRWCKQKGKVGGQNKIPRLSNDRNFIEELILLEKQP
ncbi:GH3 auxin-responsive promoter family protein [Halosquirtibacter xylanolyticus]|uniref:GH3 auxin-responsive promoter family protein n=1 Tax=Halosquirtibacter xylanolyticus TaxID=3374599 RepID=UPI00374861C9|nr:GH3 auxin-responsive promoter family protein [Prolixibacteraceae bacterium]